MSLHIYLMHAARIAEFWRAVSARTTAIDHAVFAPWHRAEASGRRIL